MERLIEILEEIQPGVDYANCKDLVDGHHLESPLYHRPGGRVGGRL